MRVVRLVTLAAFLIDDRARLGALSGAWAELLARSGTNEITLHPEWALPWWDVFGDAGGRALRCVAFYDGDTLVGLAPLLARPFVHRLRLPFRRIEALASGEDEADETYSHYLGVVAARGFEGAVAAAFAHALASGLLGAWDELVLPAMSGESPLVSILERELERERLHVSVDAYETAPLTPLPSTFEEYLDRLDAKRREQLRAWLEALDAWSGGPPELARVRSGEELAEARAILERHHESAAYRSARFRAFHDRVMPRLLELGALDVGVLRARGEPIAAFYNLRWNGRVSHYQSAYAPGVPEEVRIGVTLQALLIRAAIDDGMREYDFLGGVFEYKMALATQTRRLVTLRAARPSLIESARRVASLATTQARRIRAFANRRGFFSR